MATEAGLYEAHASSKLYAIFEVYIAPTTFAEQAPL